MGLLIALSFSKDPFCTFSVPFVKKSCRLFPEKFYCPVKGITSLVPNKIASFSKSSTVSSLFNTLSVTFQILSLLRAEQNGETLNSFINRAITETMERDNQKAE